MSQKSTAFRIDHEKYGGKHGDHLFEIYKLFVQTTESVSNRRQSTNSFFLTLNSAIVALGSYLISCGSSLTPIVIPLVGVLVGYVWYLLIKSYRDLNSAKFKVIHEIEQKLPLAVFDAEWLYLGRGDDSSKYLRFTFIERVIPLIFIAIHALVLILNIRKIC